MKADVVVANILAGPLRELAPLISVLPVEGGLLGLSVSWQARQTAFAKPMPISSRSTRWLRKKSGAVLPVVKNKPWRGHQATPYLVCIKPPPPSLNIIVLK
jgi:hypothetical protein